MPDLKPSDQALPVVVLPSTNADSCTSNYTWPLYGLSGGPVAMSCHREQILLRLGAFCDDELCRTRPDEVFDLLLSFVLTVQAKTQLRIFSGQRGLDRVGAMDTSMNPQAANSYL